MGTELRASSIEAGASEYEKVPYLLEHSHGYGLAPPGVSGVYAGAPLTMRHVDVHAYGVARPSGVYDQPGSRLDS